MSVELAKEIVKLREICDEHQKIIQEMRAEIQALKSK